MPRGGARGQNLGHLYKVFFYFSVIEPTYADSWSDMAQPCDRERDGSVVECRTPEPEVWGSKPTSAVLCPWARHFTPRKYWLITQEAVAPSRHDWKIVDWDVKPQHKQTNQPCDMDLWVMKWRSVWPIFHGPVILSYIMKIIWCMYIILWEYESVRPDVWPKN